jgi:hypothetical protein
MLDVDDFEEEIREMFPKKEAKRMLGKDDKLDIREFVKDNKRSLKSYASNSLSFKIRMKKSFQHLFFMTKKRRLSLVRGDLDREKCINEGNVFINTIERHDLKKVIREVIEFLLTNEQTKGFFNERTASPKTASDGSPKTLGQDEAGS